MEKAATKITGAWLLRPRPIRDDRGFFLESCNRASSAGLGLGSDFVQDNHIQSAEGVLRGLHYQIGEAAQTKLVWVAAGAATMSSSICGVVRRPSGNETVVFSLRTTTSSFGFRPVAPTVFWC